MSYSEWSFAKLTPKKNFSKHIALAEIKMKDLMLTEKDSGKLAIALEY